MNRKALTLMTCFAAGAAVGGCNLGMQPEGASPAEIKQRREALPASEQYKLLDSAPMSPAEKQKWRDDIEKKTGVKYSASSNSGGGPAGRGAPSAAK